MSAAACYDILSGDKFVNRPEKQASHKKEVKDNGWPKKGLYAHVAEYGFKNTKTELKDEPYSVRPYDFQLDSISLMSLDTNKSGELTSQLTEKQQSYNNTSFGTIQSPAYSSVPSRLVPSYAGPKTEFNYMLIRINNYIKINECGNESHVDIIKRLNNFIYNNDTFDIEFIALDGLKYNILSAGLGITDRNSFISNENIEIIQTDDLAKHLRNMAEALNFLKGETGDNSGVPAVIKDGKVKRLEPTELGKYLEFTNKSTANMGKKTDSNSETNTLLAPEPNIDPEPINDGIDAFYSVSDFGRTDFMHGLSGQSPLQLNNLAADDNILNKYVVLYNSQFFNTMVIQKHLYETVITGADSELYIPEIEVVREIVLSNEFALKECQELLNKQIYYTKADINKDLDYFMNKATGDYPSLENIRQYIQQAYELDNNCENRIQFKNLCDDIFLNLNVAKKYQECVKRSLPMIFAGLGLEKKRYSEGVFWFGIKPRTDTIYKAREDDDAMTRKLTPDEAQRLMDIEINARANIDKSGAAMFERQRILGYLPLHKNGMTAKEIKKKNQDNRKFVADPETW
jgi:hypothetical protein